MTPVKMFPLLQSGAGTVLYEVLQLQVALLPAEESIQTEVILFSYEKLNKWRWEGALMALERGAVGKGSLVCRPNAVATW